MMRPIRTKAIYIEPSSIRIDGRALAASRRRTKSTCLGRGCLGRGCGFFRIVYSHSRVHVTAGEWCRLISMKALIPSPNNDSTPDTHPTPTGYQ